MFISERTRAKGVIDKMMRIESAIKLKYQSGIMQIATSYQGPIHLGPLDHLQRLGSNCICNITNEWPSGWKSIPFIHFKDLLANADGFLPFACVEEVSMFGVRLSHLLKYLSTRLVTM